jgi:hypothetical protein
VLEYFGSMFYRVTPDIPHPCGEQADARRFRIKINSGDEDTHALCPGGENEQTIASSEAIAKPQRREQKDPCGNH